MDSVEQLIQNLDPETRRRLDHGRYLRLLEKYLPPPDDSNYRRWRNHTLSAIPRGRECRDIVSAWIKPQGARVLDFGCGDGGFTVAFAQAGAVVTAIDNDATRIERAQALAEDFGVSADFRLDRDYGRALPEHSFDLIVCNDVIEHVDSFRELAQAQARLLQPSGLLYINPPNRFSLRLLGSDPHYGLCGVSLLHRNWGEWYVTKVRKKAKTYALNRLLGFHEVARLYESVGLRMTCYSEEKLRRRLQTADLPAPWQRGLARLLPDSLLLPPLKLFMLDQWIFIGRPRAEPGTISRQD